MAGGGGFKLPEALTKSPKCFIALSGLDTKNNAIHRAVWDEFTSGGRRMERKPVLYKDIPADHLYPKCCTNRTSYEDYVPLGIMKSSWFHKHLEELPSLVVFFFDLDWNDPQWEEKQTECASKIEVIRSALEGRASEIAIVLLQSTPPVPVGGEVSTFTSERATMLCTSCSLPRLNLFVLPFTDRPQGFITRLEDAFYERAIQYYSGQIRRVRAHREQLSKQSHQLLHIRHQFKIAFYTEMKQEPAIALRLYRGAYNYLLEAMVLSEDRIMEFKLIAGFLCYKVCRLCFESDEPVSAITHFRKHMERFSKEVGPRQLAYEHAEWTSRQFSAFGDLFSEAVKRGLKAMQTQNPGIYYHQAAVFAIERKKLSHKLCFEAAKSVQLQSETLPETVYFGQRPWRKDLRDDQPSNMELRQKCMYLMQAMEYTVQHSWQIIPLLSKAVSHFKNYRSERMITHLKVLMGEEYYQVKEYEKTLTLLRGVTEVYRREQWWKALTSILQTVLRCSFLLGHWQDYFTAALELIGGYIPIAEKEKLRIQKNIMAILSGHAPESEPGVDSDALGVAREMWAGLYQSDQPMEFSLQVSSLASCMECKTAFTQASFQADAPIELKVHLRSNAPLPITISKLMVLFYQEEYNSWCVLSECLTLEPRVTRTLSFSFPISQTTVGDTLEVHVVEAVLGQGEGEGCEVTLVWSHGVSERFSSLPTFDLSWEKLNACNTTLIHPRIPSLSLSTLHSTPALVSEYYPLHLVVGNEEEETISNLRVGVALTELLDEAQTTAELFPSLPTTPLLQQHTQSLELEAGDLGPGAKYETTVYLCSHGVGTRKLNVNVTYSIACRVREEWAAVVCTCVKEDLFMVQTVKPFDVTYRLMSTQLKTLDTISLEEPFLLMMEIHSQSPWQLLIVGSHFNQPKNMKEVGPTNPQIEGLELGSGDKASECHCLVTMRSQGQQNHVTLGTYTVQWRRASDPQSVVLTSTVTLPTIPARSLSFTVTADIPACGSLQEVLPISYTVHNRTVFVQEFEARIGASDAFMYSGKRLSRFRVLPRSSHTLTYNLYPVATGTASLPHLELHYQREPKAGDQLLRSSLPSSVFIKPSSISRDGNSELPTPA